MTKLQISKIEINNFRAIEHSIINLNERTVLIGKNNIGKTSLLDAFAVFNSQPKLSDFNINFLIRIMNLKNNPEELSDKDCLRLKITYDWEKIGSEYWSLLSDIADSGQTIVDITYYIPPENYIDFKKIESVKDIPELFVRNINIGSENDFLKNKASTLSKSMHLNKLLPLPVYNLESNRPGDLLLFPIKAFRYVSSGKDNNTDATANQFSTQISEMIGSDDSVQTLFKSIQSDIDKNVTPKMDSLQNDLKSFAYPKNPDNPLRAILTIDEWMKNPSIRISQTFEDLNGFELPLKSQGLGYQNIYNIIARISSLFSQMEKLGLHNPVYFAIEEPEAFTHPQLQHIFVQQINEFILKKAKEREIPFQLLLISHSPEIAVSAFEMNFQIVLGRKYGNNTRFIDWNSIGDGSSRNKLKKLILNYNAELLFADKIIAYEGNAERITLTALIRKHNPQLLSDKIAFIPVGTSFHKLAPAISDIGYKKILLITDVDFKMNEENGKPIDPIKTTNSNLVYLSDNPDEVHTSDVNIAEKRDKELSAITNKSSLAPQDAAKSDSLSNNFMITTQGYNKQFNFWPRTFESALVTANPSNIDLYREKEMLNSNFDSTLHQTPEKLNIVDKYLIGKSKADFALDGLDIISSQKFIVPDYISEGLDWLANNDQ